MRAPKTGRTYRRSAITRAASPDLPRGLRTRTGPSGKARTITGYNLHRASAPGEAPAIDQSILINSILVQPVESLSTTIDVLAPHSAAVEAIRPVFGPTLDEVEPAFVRRIDDEVRSLCL